MANPLDLAGAKEYLGATAASDADVQDALDAEWAAQVGACGDRSADYPDDLLQALKRRVARNLAMRGVLLGLAGQDAEGGGAQRVYGVDPEIKRLERRYRKLVLA